MHFLFNGAFRFDNILISSFTISLASLKPDQIPITVIIPHPFDSLPPASCPFISRQFDLESPPHRLWLSPPQGAKAIQVTIKLLEPSQEVPVMASLLLHQIFALRIPVIFMLRLGSITTAWTKDAAARENS
jgi:hypothetical protein